MKPWLEPTVENAPCPPFFVDNVYELLINQSKENNLPNDVVEDIRIKCSIEIPTTTTTTTTSTSTSTTTTTTPEPSTSPVFPTTNGTVTESENVTSTTGAPFNDTVTEITENFVTSTHFSTHSNQNTSDIVTNRTSESVTKSTVTTTEIIFNTTDISSENVTVTNVTIITGAANEPVYSGGCQGICLIGIATGAVCLCMLLLLIIALATLFRKGRESKTRSRSRSRSRFGDIPDVDLYDSIDIGDSPSSKRNSSSSLFRRSGDFSRSPPVVFDNPAYRRSFELRPRRHNSWYDPEATDFRYSQNNANLINRRSRSPERRSVSTSRLHDKQTTPEHRRHGSGSSWHSSIREYVPKMLYSSSAGNFDQNSPYVHRSQNGLLQNGTDYYPNNRTLPRTPIENREKHKETRQKLKNSQRSRSYDPDMSSGSGSWIETQSSSKDNGRSSCQYIKNNQSKKSRVKRNKTNSKGKEKRHSDVEIPFDRIYRTNSESRGNHLPVQYPNYSSYNGNSSKIISSNLHPVSYQYHGPIDSYNRDRNISNSDRSPDVNDYYAGQERSFRNHDNNRRHSNRHSSYKPESNEIYMFQTKL